MLIAGKEDTRSDCRVEIEITGRGGIAISLTSKVGSLYGESIRRQVNELCAAFGVRHAAVRLVDQGALPFTIAARLEAALLRSGHESTGDAGPPPVNRPQVPHARTRLRRTRLYLPGNEPRFFINAGLHHPDAVVLDLEDSVSPEEKDSARVLVRNALRAVDFMGAEGCVRINQGRPGLDDLRAILSSHPDVILIPKCDDADEVQSVDAEVRIHEKKEKGRSQPLLIPIIETARGVVNAYRIATASSRVCALAIGLEDYTADIGAERTLGGKESFFARSTVINAAKGAGVQALDSVFSDVDDMEGLRASTLEARSLGFDGKGCIHPRQIHVIHDAFAPTAEEIGKARRIVEAAAEARRSGSGVVALGSKMIDAPVVARAERVLRLASLSGAGEGTT
jgi:citrate lyase subunit beta/citryl-CoA lyase